MQLHHPYVSAAENDTELAPLVEIVAKHQGIVMNGHDHCLGHFYFNDTNFILSGAAGYPQAGDCNNGTAQGPYALYLGANNLTGKYHLRTLEEGDASSRYYLNRTDLSIAANGFVTMDISKNSINVEYYARDMKFEGMDLYPVEWTPGGMSKSELANFLLIINMSDCMLFYNTIPSTASAPAPILSSPF